MITMDKKKIIILITLSLLLNGCNQSDSSIVDHATVNVETSNDHDNGNEESTETTEQNTGTVVDETTEEMKFDIREIRNLLEGTLKTNEDIQKLNVKLEKTEAEK